MRPHSDACREYARRPPPAALRNASLHPVPSLSPSTSGCRSSLNSRPAEIDHLSPPLHFGSPVYDLEVEKATSLAGRNNYGALPTAHVFPASNIRSAHRGPELQQTASIRRDKKSRSSRSVRIRTWTKRIFRPSITPTGRNPALASRSRDPTRRPRTMKRTTFSAALLAGTLLTAGFAEAHDHAAKPTELKQFGNLPHATAPMPAESDVPFWDGLTSQSFPITTANPAAQRYFDQGLILAYGFNHWEARRSFQGGAAGRPELRHVFLGRGAGARAEHQLADGGGGGRAGACRNRPGPGACRNCRRQGAGADRRAGAPLFRRPGRRARGARHGLCRRHAGGREALPGRSRHRHALRGSRDGPVAVGLLGRRRHDAEGPDRRPRRHAGTRARCQSKACRRHPLLHPHGGGVGSPGAGGGLCRPPRRAKTDDRPPRAHAVAHLLPARPLPGFA